MSYFSRFSFFIVEIILENVSRRTLNFVFCDEFFPHISLSSSLFSGIKTNEKPFFDEIFPRNVSVVVDDTAILKCVVKNKGDRTVSRFFLLSTVISLIVRHVKSSEKPEKLPNQKSRYIKNKRNLR